MAYYKMEGTLRPVQSFDAASDCEKLRKAMKGIGTDEKAIIEVLGFRSCSQRLEIVNKFKTMFGKSLKKELKSEISGHFLEVCRALCLAPDVFDASELYKAMKGAGTKESVLIEILCTRTNAQIKMLKDVYFKKHHQHLEKDIESETSGHFKRLLISAVQASREESADVDRNEAVADAQILFKAGEQKIGTDESRFNVILMSKSYSHLRAVFEEYSRIAGKDIEQSIKSEMSGDLKMAFLAVIRCIKYPPGYFAHQLKKSMKGLGTKDDMLVRIIVSRCEIDMVQIKEQFAAKTKGKTLGMWIADDISGDYRKIILALIGEPAMKK